MTTKQKTKRLPDERREEPRSGDDRPQHLAASVLASYQERTGHTVGTAFDEGEIAGGTIYQPRAVCINGSADRSRWRVQCYTGFMVRVDGDMLPRYLPKPTAVVWVDEAGKITEICA